MQQLPPRRGLPRSRDQLRASERYAEGKGEALRRELEKLDFVGKTKNAILKLKFEACRFHRCEMLAAALCYSHVAFLDWSDAAFETRCW